MPLRDCQLAMAAYLTSPPGPAVPATLHTLLAPAASRADKRLAVYKNNFYARFADALRDTFPVVERLVGKEFFHHAAVEYIVRMPPTADLLLDYGKRFPNFLSTFPAASSVPYLPDVATLEFLYLESYHAADAGSIDPARSSSDGERLTLHPSARLLTSPFQISRIWELNCSDASIDDVILPQLREYLLVIRPEHEVEVRRLSCGMYAALLTIAYGACRAEAHAAAAQADPNGDFETQYESLVRGGTFVTRTTTGVDAS